MKYPERFAGRRRGTLHKRRPLTGQYAFVSYSTKNWSFVEKLVKQLMSDGVWVDKWNIDAGDALPIKVEAGISGSSEFVFVLSKESLASNWAKYESHMAVIRHLEDSNFRIVVVRIDESDVPLRFKPFLYIDGARNHEAAIKQVVDAIKDRREGHAGTLFRRQFVNRAEEIGQIELAVGDPDRSLICLLGLYGMGKRTTAEEAIKRIWQKPAVTVIQLSEAHFGARLALELSAIARTDLPRDGASREEVRRASLLAVETLIAKGQILVFDRMETLLDDFGVPHPDLGAVIQHASEIKACYKVPVFLLSRHMPHLDPDTAKRLALVKVSSLMPQHTVTILENEAMRIRRDEIAERSALVEVAKQLHGYPLAARLAAPLLVKYSPEYLLQNLIHVRELRRDVAEAILSHTHLTTPQVQVLKVLSICDGALTVPDISSITERSADDVVNDIDCLADDNLIEPEGVAVRLHPLVLDFYWKQARSSPDFSQVVSAIAEHSQAALKRQVVGSINYIQWLAVAVRTLFLSGKPGAARQLRSDLIGELKVACIELYQRREYELCLRYCEEYLAAAPEDFEVSLHKARCLSRLGRDSEALVLLDHLMGSVRSRHGQTRTLFAIARTHFEARRDDEAKRFYLKTLDSDPRYLPALEGITELLLRVQNFKEADGFVLRALEVAPMNSWALSAHADLLWRKGKVQEAIAEMEKVVKSQPDNPTFLFRLGRLYQQSGAIARAYELFKRSAENDHTYVDPRLSVASVAINLGKLDEAERQIRALKDRVPPEKKHILTTIEADYLLSRGEVEESARLAASALEQRRDVVTLGIMAKVEAAKWKLALEAGTTLLSESHKTRAQSLIEEGLKLDPQNGPLRTQLEMLSER